MYSGKWSAKRATNQTNLHNCELTTDEMLWSAGQTNDGVESNSPEVLFCSDFLTNIFFSKNISK